MKKFSVLALVAIALLAAVAVSAAEEAAEETATTPVDHPAMLAKMDGKEIYRNVCKNCHGADAEAGEYTPMSLIMEQWDEFFQDTFSQAHEAVACPSDATKKLIDVLDKDALKKVQKFCVDHAADSEQPMTCG